MFIGTPEAVNQSPVYCAELGQWICYLGHSANRVEEMRCSSVKCSRGHAKTQNDGNTCQMQVNKVYNFHGESQNRLLVRRRTANSSHVEPSRRPPRMLPSSPQPAQSEPNLNNATSARSAHLTSPISFSPASFPPFRTHPLNIFPSQTSCSVPHTPLPSETPQTWLIAGAMF
ncbi:hypothetical protein K469DRAFT_155452 [Zopfia rhizophila CBS 207.26]|uniref:Uncharacterized protein n=1 Tax=Zopfia rhizophila CBS 207.26 TaxID=1314779 RepID=A0A6A6E5C0_9PEZI|nr:hypothetical protein K469DRAFT_155452 [Zopfia rhizophila CBS 207.26]